MSVHDNWIKVAREIIQEDHEGDLHLYELNFNLLVKNLLAFS